MSDETSDHVPDRVPDQARETDVQESDPNADSPEGLAGGMGVSSEIAGHARGSKDEVTYGTLETHPDEVTDTGLPEQSPGGPDENPVDPPPKKAHPRDHG